MANQKPVLQITAGIDKKATVKNVQSQLDSISKNLKLTIGVDKNGKGEIKKQVDEYGRLLDAEKAHAQAILKDIKINESAKKKAITSEITDRERVAKIVKKQTNEEISDIERVKKAQSDLARYKEDLERRLTKLSSGKFKNQLDQSAVSSIKSQGASLKIDNVGDIAKVKMQTKELDSNLKNVALSAQQARTGITRFGEEIVDSGYKFTQYFLLGGAIVGAIGQIQQAVQATYDLDNAINQVRIVTGQTEEQAQSLVGTFKELGKTANVSLTDTANLYADLTRQGLEGSALEDRFLAISKYSKISGLDVSKSMDIITSAVNGTKRPVEEIIDVFAVLGDKSSADSAEIGEALQRTASVANVAGIDFKKLSSYIATVSETTRTAASVVGQSMRSMIVRFNQLRAEGFNSDDTSTMNDVIKALSTIGIDAFDDSTQSLMNLSDILEQLAPKWETLDGKTRAYVSTALFGQYQADKGIALLENFGRAQELYGYALDSSGQATEKFEIYQESAQAKVEKFQLALENLYTTLVGSSALKEVIDTGTDFVNLLNLASKDVTTLIPLVLSLASAFTALKASSLVAEGGMLAGLGLSAGPLGAIAVAVGAVAVAILSVKTAMEDAKIATENFKKAQEELNYVLGEGGDSAKKRQKDIEDLVVKYEEASRALSTARAVLAQDENEDFSGNLQRGVTKAMEVIQGLEKEFKKLGITSSEAKQMIKQLTDEIAQRDLANESVKTLEVVKAKQAELDTVSNLANSYVELGDKQNKSQKESELLKSKSELLKSSLQKLGIQFEVNSDGLITNVSNVQKLILAEQNLTEAEKANALKRMNIRKQALEATLKSISTELKAREILARAMYYETQAFKNVIEDPLNLKGEDRKGSEATRLSAMQDEMLKGKQKQAQEDLDNIKNVQAEMARLDAGTGGLLNPADDSKDKSSKSTSTKITLLTALEKQLEINNFQLELQRKLTSELSEDDTKRIDSLKKEISLLAQRQKLISAQADVLRKEKASIEAKIKSNKATMEEKKRLEEVNTEIYALKLSWQDLNGQMITASKSIADFGKESKEAIAKANIEAVDELKEAIKSLIEQEYEDKIDAEKKSIEFAKEELDIRLKQIEAEKELADFMADRADKEKDIKTIDSKIISLQTAANQGDMKAKSELLKLQEERAEKQKSLDELINDRAYELTKESLQNQYDEFEDTSNKRIDKYEAELKEAGTIAKRVNSELASYLNGTNSQLYQQLISWNSQYGTGMDSDIIGKWNTAIQLLQTYKSQLGSISGVNVGDYETAQNVGVDKYKDESVIAQMKANSAKWFTSTPEERKKLNNENRMLATSIGATFNEKEGRYYKNGVKLYDNGGHKPLGEIGVLGENVEEWVMKDKNIIDLSKMAIQQFTQTIPNFSNIQPSFSNSLNSQAPVINFTVNGGIANESDRNAVLNGIKDLAKQVTQTQMDSFRNRGMKPLTRTR